MPPSRVGFEGKLPSRGDFVGRGLPRSFLTPWREWIDASVLASRAALSDAWLEAWLEAPIWHFGLPGGACGPDAVMGVWIPSVDRAGRHHPLTVAAVFEGRSPPPSLDAGRAWLAAAEEVALDALGNDREPDELMRAVEALPACDVGTAVHGMWRTEGAPRVPPTCLTLDALPEPASFASLLDRAF